MMKYFSELAPKAFQYGPFLFALVYLVIARWACNAYTNACKRKDPPASDREKNTYRLYFLGTAGFGGTLVVVSIIWWCLHQPFIHVFKGVIKDLSEYEKITSGDLYFNRVFHEPTSPEDLQYYDAHFVATQERPFTASQVFTLRYRKKGVDWENCVENTTSPETLDLYYCTEAAPRFKIRFDEKLGMSACRKISATPKSSSLLVNVAHAQRHVEPSGPKGLIHNSTSSLKLPTSHKSINPKIIDLLQKERTDIPTKIAILDELNTLSHEELKEYIEASTSKEPMILTLLDLGRHTDEELAYKTRRIMEQVDWNTILVNRLLSADIEIRKEAETMLFRMEGHRAEAILRKASNKMERARLRNLQEEIRSGQRTRVLIPTGSSQGDRYYVEAEWDPREETLVASLTELFNRELITDRTLEEEARLMMGRTERYVYWYSKEWALGIAEEIEQCGARTNFIGFTTSTSK